MTEPEEFGPWPGTPAPWARKPGERFKHDNSAGVKAVVTGLGRQPPHETYIAAALDLNYTPKDDEVEHNATGIAVLPDAYEALRLVANTKPKASPAGDRYIIDPLVMAAVKVTLRRMLGEL